MSVIALRETPVFVEIYREVSRAIPTRVCIQDSRIVPDTYWNSRRVGWRSRTRNESPRGFLNAPGESCRAARTSCCRQVTDVARIKCRKMVGRVPKGAIVISRRAPNFDVDSEACRWIDRRNNTERFQTTRLLWRWPATLRKNRTSHQNKHKSNSVVLSPVRIVIFHRKRMSHISRTVHMFFEISVRCRSNKSAF